MEFWSKETGNRLWLGLQRMQEVDLYNASELEEYTLSSANVYAGQDVVLDMANIRYIDSSGIGKLIMIKKKLSGQQKVFHIANVNKSVFEVFKSTNIDKYFSVVTVGATS